MVRVVAAPDGNEVGVHTRVVAIASPVVIVVVVVSAAVVAADAPDTVAPAVAGPGRAQGSPFGGAPAIVVVFFLLLFVGLNQNDADKRG